MTRSEVLRELYEALDMLEASQTRRSTGPAARDGVVDLRDAPSGDGGVVVAGSLRHEVRGALGADWEQGTARW